jgi:hypothetical protein
MTMVPQCHWAALSRQARLIYQNASGQDVCAASHAALLNIDLLLAGSDRRRAFADINTRILRHGCLLNPLHSNLAVVQTFWPATMPRYRRERERRAAAMLVFARS